MTKLRDYAWPGNVRELQAVIVNAYAKAKERVYEQLPAAIPTQSSNGASGVHGEFPPVIDADKSDVDKPEPYRVSVRLKGVKQQSGRGDEPNPNPRFEGLIFEDDIELPSATAGGGSDDSTLKSLEEVLLDHILHVLEIVKGDRKKAEAILGISRTTLLAKLDQACVPRNYGEPRRPLSIDEATEKTFIEKAMRAAAIPGCAPETVVDYKAVLDALEKTGYRLPKGKTFEDRLDHLGIPRRYPCSRERAERPPAEKKPRRGRSKSRKGDNDGAADTPDSAC